MVDPTAPLNIVAPDLSGLNQPGANAAGGSMPAPNPVAPPSETMTPAMAPPNVTPNANAINPTVAPATPANVGGHGRLLSMIQGLSDGMAAFSTSLATHGKEGGAAEVQQLQAERAATQQKATEFAQSQKNAALQQQLLTGEVNRQNGQNYLLMATVPDEISKSHVTTQAANLELQQKAQDMFDTKGQVPAGWTVDPNTGMVSQVGQSSNVPAANAPASSTQPNPNVSATPNANAPATPNLLPGVNPNAQPTAAPTGNPAQPSIFQQRQNMILDAAAQELKNDKGQDDPLVTAARQVLANPASTPVQIRQATLAVQSKAGLSADVVKTLTAKADLANKQTASLPKNQQEASVQLANAKTSGDPDKIAAALANYNAVTGTVEQERKFSSDLQEANARANKDIAFTNTLAQKGIEDTNKIWTDQQHGFSQTLAQVQATKNVVAQAKNGSQLAASLEPAMTVLGVNSFAGVHRISPTEYEAAGPAVGSLYRRLNAVLDKAGKGAVPSATLSEVNGIMDALIRGKYQTSLSSTQQIVANAGIPTNRIFVPDPNNFGALTTLDKIPATGNQTGPQSAPAVPGSPASKIHAHMGDFKQITPTKEHGNLYTDDGKIWYTSDGTIYGGK